MEKRSDGMERLQRQVRMWRTAAFCLGSLAVVGGPLGVVVARAQAADAARLRAARPGEIVTIDIPAGAESSLVADGIEAVSEGREYTLTGKTDLSWKNGLKLQSKKAVVRVVRDAQTGASRVFIEPVSR